VGSDVTTGEAGLEIRAETPADRDAVAAVVAAAFGGDAEAVFVDRIRASGGYVAALSLVAVAGNRVVGHVMVSHVGLHDDGHDRRIASLSPLAVSPDVHARGIGSALVRAVTARAEELGEPLIVLEGDPGYYGRFGFEWSVPLGIQVDLPSWAPPEAAQVLRLRGYDPAIRGRVVYPPAFDDVIEH
jgi:putative acetyltransferase